MSNPQGLTSRMTQPNQRPRRRSTTDETAARRSRADPSTSPRPRSCCRRRPKRSARRRATSPPSAGSPRRRDSTRARPRSSTPPADPATEVMLPVAGPDGSSRNPLRRKSFRRAATHRSRRAPSQLGLGDGADPGHRRAGGRRDPRHRAADPRARRRRRRRRTRSARRSRTSTPRSRRAISPRCAASPAAPPATATSTTTTGMDRHPCPGGRGQAVSGGREHRQVVVNDDHAEANVTTFMAYEPQTRSTRSFDLQFRDEQWKICQAERLAASPAAATSHSRSIMMLLSARDAIHRSANWPGSWATSAVLAPCCGTVIAGRRRATGLPLRADARRTSSRRCRRGSPCWRRQAMRTRAIPSPSRRS